MSQTVAQHGVNPGFPTVGRWIVTAMPTHWVYIVGFGIKQMTVDPQAIAVTVGLGEDSIPPDGALEGYIDKQKQLIGSYLKNPQFAGPQPIAFPGASEARLLFVRHVLQTGQLMLHAQNYVRVGEWVGIVTLTTPEDRLKTVRADYEQFMKGLRVGPAMDGTDRRGE